MELLIQKKSVGVDAGDDGGGVEWACSIPSMWIWL